MSGDEREEDIAGKDLSAENAAETAEDNFFEIDTPAQHRLFYEATIKQLAPLIKSHKCASLLRDTTISEDAGVALSHQLRFVHRKAIAVNKYCEFQLARQDDSSHIIHDVLRKSSETPSKAVRAYVGTYLDPQLSGVQVGRYLSEYIYFDAVAHHLPVTEFEGPRGDALFGRAVMISPGGKGGFHMDRRGQFDHTPNWIFHETDLKLSCQRYMLAQKGEFL